MADAVLRSDDGGVIVIDYTPSSGNVAAGEMVLLGNTAGPSMGIAHAAIENGVQGSLAIGGGIYDCQVAGNYAAYTKVYKPTGNAILTTTSTNNAVFGYTVETSAAANAVVKVLHWPIP